MPFLCLYSIYVVFFVLFICICYKFVVSLQRFSNLILYTMSKNSRLGSSISRYNVMATLGSGKAGNVRLYQKGDRSYIRAAYNSTVNNPRTDGQMIQRLKFASVTNFYKAVKPYINNLFEGATPYRSSSNIFRQLNQGMGVYFTKMQSQGSQCCLEDYIVSDGSLGTYDAEAVSAAALPSAGSGYNCGLGGFVCRSLSLGRKSFTDDAGIQTFGELSTVLLSHNPLLLPGDTITVLLFEQKGMTRDGGVVGIRRVVVNTVSFVLDTTSTVPVYLSTGTASSWPAEAFNASFTAIGLDPVTDAGSNVSYDFYLGYCLDRSATSITASKTDPKNGTGAAFVVTRNASGLRCSTSRIACVNSEIALLTSPVVFAAAKDSYGESTVTPTIGTSPDVIIKAKLLDLTGSSPISDTMYTVTGTGPIKRGSKITVSFALTTAGAAAYMFSDSWAGVDTQDIISSSINEDTASITFVANHDVVLANFLQANE